MQKLRPLNNGEPILQSGESDLINMANLTEFESREATLHCTAEEYYNFITDLRNFGRFIPGEVIRDWNADADSCSFNISTLGEVTLKTSSKTPFSKVVFSGNVLVTIGFNLHSFISSGANEKATVKLLMEADLPPMIKVFAAGPIQSFLETLVVEMEKFENWS